MSAEPASPQLTVVIPHLNQHEPLRRVLQSLAEQTTEASFDTIVVDNGSSELPTAVVGSFAFARLLEEPTPGPGPARSTGARASDAPLLAFIDADCVADPEWIDEIVTFFGIHASASVLGGDVRILPAKVNSLTGLEAYESIWGYRNRMYVLEHGYVATLNMAVRADVFARVGDFCGIERAEDMDWGRRATTLGISLEYLPSMVVRTPARETLAELRRKWDRQIRHDATEVTSARAYLRWFTKAFSLAISPPVEVPLLLRSDRVSGVRTRLAAFGWLVLVRFHRAGSMVSAVTRRTSAAEAWRRG